MALRLNCESSACRVLIDSLLNRSQTSHMAEQYASVYNLHRQIDLATFAVGVCLYVVVLVWAAVVQVLGWCYFKTAKHEKLLVLLCFFVGVICSVRIGYLVHQRSSDVRLFVLDAIQVVISATFALCLLILVHRWIRTLHSDDHLGFRSSRRCLSMFSRGALLVGMAIGISGLVICVLIASKAIFIDPVTDIKIQNPDQAKILQLFFSAVSTCFAIVFVVYAALTFLAVRRAGMKDKAAVKSVVFIFVIAFAIFASLSAQFLLYTYFWANLGSLLLQQDAFALLVPGTGTCKEPDHDFEKQPFFFSQKVFLWRFSPCFVFSGFFARAHPNLPSKCQQESWEIHYSWKKFRIL